MVQIIPAIIAKDLGDLKRKIGFVKNEVVLVQLDVMDGEFVTEKSFGSELSDIEGVKQLEDVFFEIHLMTKDPLSQIKEWGKLPNVKRIIFHFEALSGSSEMEACLIEIKNQGKEAGLALNLETPLEAAGEWLDKFDLILLMSVKPGRAGQKFDENVIHKLKTLRSFQSGGKIEVDGGANQESAIQSVDAGADVLAVGSFVFKSVAPADQIKKMKQAVNN